MAREKQSNYIPRQGKKAAASLLPFFKFQICVLCLRKNYAIKKIRPDREKKSCVSFFLLNLLA
jgi:hypothetical protein